MLVGYDGAERVKLLAESAKKRFGVEIGYADGSSEAANGRALADAEIVLSAPKAGIRVVSKAQLAKAPKLLVAADVNAVPPSSIEGVEVQDDGKPIPGTQALGHRRARHRQCEIQGPGRPAEAHDRGAEAASISTSATLSISRARLLAEPSPVLIVALSARSLALAASRAGYRAAVVDLFGDVDTRRLAARNAVVPGDLGLGFEAEALIAAAEDLAPPGGSEVWGLVYGSGLESRPELLEILSRGRRLWGNRPEVLRAIKDPAYFFGMLDRLGLPHPEIRSKPPAETTGWLVERRGRRRRWAYQRAEPGERDRAPGNISSAAWRVGRSPACFSPMGVRANCWAGASNGLRPIPAIPSASAARCSLRACRPRSSAPHCGGLDAAGGGNRPGRSQQHRSHGR